MLLSIVVGISLLAASALAFHLYRDRLHPAIVFPFVWGLTIFTIGLAEPYGYYQISPQVLLVFILGNCVFMLGAILNQKKIRTTTRQLEYKFNFNKVFWFCIALHLILAPLSWIEILKISAGAGDIFEIAYRLRVVTVSGEEKVVPMIGNYLTVGSFFIPLLWVGWMQKEIKLWKLIAGALPWVFLIIIMSGRSGLIVLTFSLLYIYLSCGGKISIKAAVAFGVIFTTIVVVGNLLVGKIEADINSSSGSILSQSMASFFDYYLQGPILFSEYFEHPASINPTWDALIFPCHILEKFNLCVVPPLHQQFMVYSRAGDSGNVYSVFLSIYPKYGWLGIIFLMGVFGFWTAHHHKRSKHSFYHLLMASFLFSSILLSIFSDLFATSIYFFLKIFFISLGVSFVFRKS